MVLGNTLWWNASLAAATLNFEPNELKKSFGKLQSILKNIVLLCKL